MKIKKTSYSFDGGKVLNEQNSSTTDTYSCNFINNITPKTIVELGEVGEFSPDEPSIGDKWYDTTTNLIYTYDGKEWGDGVAPEKEKMYIVPITKSSYYYNGTTLISVGGDSNKVYVEEEEPETANTGDLYIDPNAILNTMESEVVNSLSGDETTKAPSVSAVNDYVEEQINSIKAYELYYNVSGSKETITLSDDITNYRYVEVIMTRGEGTSSSAKAIVNSSGKAYLCVMNGYYGYGTGIWVDQKTVAISGTTLTTHQYYDFHGAVGSNNAITYEHTENLKVMAVIGWK